MNYVEGDFGTMAESGASGPSDYQEHKRVLRSDMAAASKAYLPQYADGPDGLRELLACVSAPTDPRDAEIARLRADVQFLTLAYEAARDVLRVSRAENAALRESLAAAEAPDRWPVVAAKIGMSPHVSTSTALSRALSLPNTTDTFGR